MSQVYLTTEQARGRSFRRGLLTFALSLFAAVVLMFCYAWTLRALQPGLFQSVTEQLTTWAMLLAMLTAAAAVGYIVANRLSSISLETVRYGAGIAADLLALFLIFVLLVNLQFALGIPK